MKSIEVMGKNVEEAIQKGLNELKLTKDEVEVEIIEEGSKGLFGFIGTKDAKVKLTEKKNYTEEARSFLRKVLNAMDIKSEIRIKDEGSALKITLSGPNMGLIIGHRGETLDSLQYLVSLAINKDNDEQYKRVILDTENYRYKREQTLKRLADKMAQKVKQKGRSVKLEPMNPYERRVIHSALQGDSEIKTYSEGQEPYRRVVIDLKKA
ncbi:RNA-binding cell elongation regulator Jag/EloR [Haloimpatiens lingqiaonensis]|uniref:RNA-binding cell elongation regulator Jag/EloR n=1 Tax=Haloimpatiens lingqiaonensis TaxID=1380675 RepID=UPI0010FF12B2|nr:RNA-binding cell elongation regulator Jag/EloR [Haloimpatiens lingqiaonensis]